MGLHAVHLEKILPMANGFWMLNNDANNTRIGSVGNLNPIRRTNFRVFSPLIRLPIACHTGLRREIHAQCGDRFTCWISETFQRMHVSTVARQFT